MVPTLTWLLKRREWRNINSIFSFWLDLEAGVLFCCFTCVGLIWGPRRKGMFPSADSHLYSFKSCLNLPGLLEGSLDGDLSGCQDVFLIFLRGLHFFTSEVGEMRMSGRPLLLSSVIEQWEIFCVSYILFISPFVLGHSNSKPAAPFFHLSVKRSVLAWKSMRVFASHAADPGSILVLHMIFKSTDPGVGPQHCQVCL